ncbi:uncharacterized protein LOC127556323 [Antechinus flavipes]|uniref:uncharacterized protein LOC127556323 n=1 Tax=Antechinus flavipes TaxID=38775 RepID=UPI00223640B8|nr:uncharacterized protein LOC127556323 [Antechinus flavipes]
MASSPSGPQEKKGTLNSHNSPTPAVLTRSEEYLVRISTELTNEALMGAQYPIGPDLPKELKKLDQGTQMSRHVPPTTRTKGTDTRSDRNRTRNKTHLLPSREMVEDFKDEKVKLLKSKEKDLSQHKQVETVRQEDTLGGSMYLIPRWNTRRSTTIPEGLSSYPLRKEQGSIKREELDSMEGSDREGDFHLGKIFHQNCSPAASKSSGLLEVLKQRLDDHLSKRL